MIGHDRNTFVIGLDLDNTIIDYGSLFYNVALEKKWIPLECSKDKTGVREYLQTKGRNDLWTELQGLIYGPFLTEAVPYEGVDVFLLECRKLKIPVWIISHKTRFPAAGFQYDLHAAASAWLLASGLIQNETGGVNKDRVLFCETRSEKIAAIIRYQLTHFVDDLPEVLFDAGFPKATTRYLYAPNGIQMRLPACEGVNSWQDLKRIILDST
jgi:hypothetical protein